MRKGALAFITIGTVLLADTRLVLSQEARTPLAPKAWVNEGDSDGDGLTDAFELAHGLDPSKAASFADGIADEARLAANGRTMDAIQAEERARASRTDASGSKFARSPGSSILDESRTAEDGRTMDQTAGDSPTPGAVGGRGCGTTGMEVAILLGAGAMLRRRRRKSPVLQNHL